MLRANEFEDKSRRNLAWFFFLFFLFSVARCGEVGDLVPEMTFFDTKNFSFSSFLLLRFKDKTRRGEKIFRPQDNYLDVFGEADSQTC